MNILALQCSLTSCCLPQIPQNNIHSSSNMVPTLVSSLNSPISLISPSSARDFGFLSFFPSSFLPLLLLFVLLPFHPPPWLLLPSHYLHSSLTLIQQKFQQWTPISVIINPSCRRDLTFYGCLDLSPSTASLQKVLFT